jgi:hypothetical protein
VEQLETTGQELMRVVDGLSIETLRDQATAHVSGTLAKG